MALSICSTNCILLVHARSFARDGLYEFAHYRAGVSSEAPNGVCRNSVEGDMALPQEVPYCGYIPFCRSEDLFCGDSGTSGFS